MAIVTMWKVSVSSPNCQSGYKNGELRSYDTPVWGDHYGEIGGQGPGCQSGHSRGDLLSYATLVRRSVIHFLVIRVDIGGVIFEAITPKCGRSEVQFLVIIEDIGVVTCEVLTPHSGRSIVQILVVRVDT